MDIEIEFCLKLAKKKMNSSRVDDRIQACREFGGMGAGMDHLEELAIDENPRVRSAAIEALTRFEYSNRMMETVASALNDSNCYVVQAALIAVTKFREPYDEDEQIIKLARHVNKRTRRLALRAIGAARLPGQQDHLLSVLKNGDWTSREGAAGGLRLFRDPSTVDEIVRELTDEIGKSMSNRVVIRELMRCLGSCGATPDQLSILTKILEEVIEHRSVAAKLIGELGYQDARVALEASLQDKSEKLIRSSLRALTMLGPQKSIAFIRPLLRHNQPEVVAATCKACAISKDTASLPELCALTFDTRSAIRVYALSAIKEIDLETGQQLALLFMNDNNYKVQALSHDILEQHPPADDLTPFDVDRMSISAKSLRTSAANKKREKFKRELISLHGLYCMVTGCAVQEVIEVVQMTPSSGDIDSRHVLLLRTDIHKLFDDGLLAINPETLKIRLVSYLHDTEYGVLEGRVLGIKTPNDIDRDGLASRWESFLRTKVEVPVSKPIPIVCREEQSLIAECAE